MTELTVRQNLVSGQSTAPLAPSNGTPDLVKRPAGQDFHMLPYTQYSRHDTDPSTLHV